MEEFDRGRRTGFLIIIAVCVIELSIFLWWVL